MNLNLVHTLSETHIVAPSAGLARSDLTWLAAWLAGRVLCNCWTAGQGKGSKPDNEYKSVVTVGTRPVFGFTSVSNH